MTIIDRGAALLVGASQVFAGLWVVEAAHAEELLLLDLEELQEFRKVPDEHSNVVFVERREGQHGAELDEEPQQVECAVDL